MKESPILFNGQMVRAVLETRKTQTRRVMKPQPINPTGPNHDGLWSDTVDPVTRYFACPYGGPGHRLWVRETWAVNPDAKWQFVYRADRGGDYQGAAQGLVKWSPSIHMPRCVSRTDLEIESVRVERVQSISDFDAFQEGAKSLPSNITGPYCQSYVEGFRQLWDSINEPRGFGWDVNPWVWVIGFSRIN